MDWMYKQPYLSPDELQQEVSNIYRAVYPIPIIPLTLTLEN